MNEKILNVEYPIVNSNSEHGYLLSGLQTNEKAWDWIISNYIHISVYFSSTGYDMNFMPMANHSTCPCINYERISNNTVKKQWDIIQFLVENIIENKYIYIHLDLYYISSSDKFKKSHGWHPTLIYGFDLQKQIFYVADFYLNRKFRFSIESFENIYDAFMSNIGAQSSYFNKRYNCADSVVLYDNITEFKYTLNTELLIQSLEDFVESRSVSLIYDRGDQIYYARTYKNYHTHFGVSSFDILANLFRKDISNEINFKLLTVPLDHTNLMIKRIDYLAEKEYIADNISIKNIFYEIQNLINVAIGLSCKYNILCESSILDKISKIYLQVKDLEIQGCNALIYQLKQKI